MWFRNTAEARDILRRMWATPDFAQAFPYDQGGLTAAIEAAPHLVCILDVPTFVIDKMPPPTQMFAHVTHLVPNRRDIMAALHRQALGDGDLRKAVQALLPRVVEADVCEVARAIM